MGALCGEAVSTILRIVRKGVSGSFGRPSSISGRPCFISRVDLRIARSFEGARYFGGAAAGATPLRLPPGFHYETCPQPTLVASDATLRLIDVVT